MSGGPGGIQRIAASVLCRGRRRYRAEFVEEKLAERGTRHEKMGGSRYVLEPNIRRQRVARSADPLLDLKYAARSTRLRTLSTSADKKRTV